MGRHAVGLAQRPALVALAVSILPIIDSWPRWVLLGIGVIVGAAVILTFPRTFLRRDGGQGGGTTINQRQRAGKKSRLIQTTGDVNLEGGMGDRN